jgi:hypothetical protein
MLITLLGVALAWAGLLTSVGAAVLARLSEFLFGMGFFGRLWKMFLLSLRA